jgi:DNA invertase Pin-like site-specific DNA recombinase
MAAQEEAIIAARQARGWIWTGWFKDEAVSGGTPWQERFGLSEAIAYIEQGHADVLMVAKLDRLTRSVGDFASLVDRAKKKGWAIVALDLGVDMTTPAGELMANVLASFAQFERRLIGQRTKDGLAAKRASGVRLGRPSTLSEEHALQMREYRFGGYTYAWIAKWANAHGIPTGQGAAYWTGSTVRAALKAWEGREK